MPELGPQFEWDGAKNADNIRKHGIDFRDAVRIFLGTIMERIDDRHDYGEIRVAATGILDGREITVYYSPRGDIRRVISARKATANERKAYYALCPRPR